MQGVLTEIVKHSQTKELDQDDHLQYSLLNGRAGGQELIGDTSSSGFLRLSSTNHATKGIIYFGAGSDNYFDEVNKTLVINAIVKVGKIGTNEAVFAHYDKFTAANYCLKQDSAGTSCLNGQNELYLKIAGVNYIACLSSKVDIQKPLQTDNISMGKDSFESWDSIYSVFQVGGNGALYGPTAEGGETAVLLTHNVYNDGTERYISSYNASKYDQGVGCHIFSCAASGTEDNPISWIDVARFQYNWVMLNGPDDDSSAVEIRAGNISYIKIDSSNNAEVLHFGTSQNLTKIIELPETYTDGIQRLVGEKVVTTDATQTTCQTITLNDDSVYHIEVDVIAIETSSITATASYKLIGTFYRASGGGATISGSVSAVHSGDYPVNLDATLDTNGNDVRIRVTGLSGTSIRWISFVTIKDLSLST